MGSDSCRRIYSDATPDAYQLDSFHSNDFETDKKIKISVQFDYIEGRIDIDAFLSGCKTGQTVFENNRGSLLRYCCSFWGCTGSTEINQLQKLQKRAARIIMNSSFDGPSRPLIEGLRWKTVDEIITDESKTMVFKSLNELAPKYLCDVFTRNSLCSSYRLRNTGTDLRLPMKRSSNGQKFFSYRSARLWKSLPAESKQATSLYS